MILNLQEIFGEQGRPVRHIAMRALMNTKMVEGTPMRDHVLKIFYHLNTLEILGDEIDVESHIDVILELSNSFNQFKLNCSMNKIDFTLSKLLNALQAVKGIIKGHPSVNNVKKYLLSKPFSKKNGKQKKKKVPSNPNKILNPLRDIDKGNEVNDPKPKKKCFHCVVAGHWKMN